jgi:FixJ family two-component response regulator
MPIVGGDVQPSDEMHNGVSAVGLWTTGSEPLMCTLAVGGAYLAWMGRRHEGRIRRNWSIAARGVMGDIVRPAAASTAGREEGGKMSLGSHPTSVRGPHNRKEPVVYVVDDDESMRLALGGLLCSVGLRVEAFESSQDFLAFPKYDAPSCLILDVRLRGESGLAFQEQIAKSGVRMPIVFMTGHGDIAMTVKAMKAGAVDFFAKPFRDQDMLDAVANALARDGERLAAEQSIAALRTAYGSLTPREREVMGFVVAGLMNKQIASEINLSEITVKIHRGQVMKKMAARSVADLVRKSESLGVNPQPQKSS